MNSKTVAINSRKSELLEAFLDQVPGRVNDILEIWHQLTDGEWNQVLLTRLLERLNTLSAASGKFEISQIRSSGLKLIAAFSSLNDLPDKPQDDALVRLDGLIKAFRDAALEACQGQSDIESAALPALETVDSSRQSCKIYLLGLEQDSAPGLQQRLESKGFEVETLANLEPLFEILNTGSIPCALIAHLSRLTEVYPDTKEGGLWHNEDGLPPIPVAFITETDDLQTRLRVLRTDAKACWARPVDPTAVAQRMRELTTAQIHAPSQILIIADDPTQAEFAGTVLGKADFACRILTEPLQLMEVLSEYRPDLILMELEMQGASGCELTALLREQNEFVDIPIVFLSDEQEPDKQLDALSCGGEDLLARPIDPERLIKTLAYRIRRARQLRDRLSTYPSDAQHTVLGTRDQLFERVDTLIKQRPADERQHAVLFLEIDNPAEISKRIGKEAMDELLTEIGIHLRRIIRPQDSLGRFGDHSLGMVANCGSKESLEKLAKKLCAEIESQQFKLENQSLTVTLSIGAYTIDKTVKDARSGFSQAKAASKIAQDGGGNQSHILPTEARQGAGTNHSSLAKLIVEAINQQYFELHFQPIVALKGTSDEAHYQTLIRLREPEGKLYTAAEFIPVAEQIGLMGKIDHWTTRSAISIIKLHQQEGRQLHLFISQTPDLLENIERLSWLREKHRRGLINENDLTFEFRLTDIAKQLNSAKVCFEMLKSINIMTLLTGVNNSAESRRVLSHLPLNYIKLDTKFIQESGQEINELITFVHTQKTKVIAPQVEDPRSIALLWNSGVDFVQGNFVQRPENNLLYDFNESVLN